MSTAITYLTAETESGRKALDEVAARSYRGGQDGIPPDWARVRLADGVPVAYILVDPERQMDLPGGALRFAFICDVATREDRRGEGHFRGLMEDTFTRLRQAGHGLVLTHGRYPLYRRFGFDVFTHHSGIFLTPGHIERHLGMLDGPIPGELLAVEEHRGLVEGLLLVSDIRVKSLEECRLALQAAAALARERGRTRILIEHPAAPSYGSRYPPYLLPETPFTALARACGAQVILQGADPEAGTIPDADWIKVLDAAALLHAVLPGILPAAGPLPPAAFGLDTDAGAVSLCCEGGELTVYAGVVEGVPAFSWPSAALAQLVTGYQPVELLCTLHHAPLPLEAVVLLGTLFSPCWRFSRNESWVYRS